MFVIFDLDGTLALNEHRQHYLDGETKDWDAFFAACGDDKPNWTIVNVFRSLRDDGHFIEVWSGRSDAVRDVTEEWLHKYVGHPVDYLTRMREAKDHTPDVILKERWLNEQIYSLRTRPDLVFDDRASVVEMWRRRGIVCAQVAPGDF